MAHVTVTFIYLLTALNCETPAGSSLLVPLQHFFQHHGAVPLAHKKGEMSSRRNSTTGSEAQVLPLMQRQPDLFESGFRSPAAQRLQTGAWPGPRLGVLFVCSSANFKTRDSDRKFRGMARLSSSARLGSTGIWRRRQFLSPKIYSWSGKVLGWFFRSAWVKAGRAHDQSTTGKASLGRSPGSCAGGISSQVRPSSSRPFFFLLNPPHCLKKKATPA